MSEMDHTTTASHLPHQHESRDADIRKLTYLAFGILVLIIFGFVVTEIIFYLYVGHQKVAPSPQALFIAGQQMPPPPRLEERPGVNLRPYLQEENSILDTYGWVNRRASVVRIPISRAMALLLRQGLPTQKPGEVTLSPSVPHEVPRGDFAPPPTPVPGPRNQ
jgi:hypothetical protein